MRERGEHSARAAQLATLETRHDGELLDLERDLLDAAARRAMTTDVAVATRPALDAPRPADGHRGAA
jgi:hypothetical protein